jgi:hypothetical protein
MFIDQETLKRVNIYAPYKGRSKLDTPEIRAAVGVIEIPDPARGNDEIEYTQELNEPPYIIITPKSAEQLERQLDYKNRIASQKHLDDTDYLFSIDRHASLLATEPAREVELKASREAAREVLRAYKVKYPPNAS